MSIKKITPRGEASPNTIQTSGMTREEVVLQGECVCYTFEIDKIDQ